MIMLRARVCARVYVRLCRRRQPKVPLVALDMDGTLLDSSSNISPDSAQVIRAATAAGVQVILATGKARPAAIAAARKAHLEGDALLVSHRKPGVFLQVGREAPCLDPVVCCTAVRPAHSQCLEGCAACNPFEGILHLTGTLLPCNTATRSCRKTLPGQV